MYSPDKSRHRLVSRFGWIYFVLSVVLVWTNCGTLAAQVVNRKFDQEDKFRQLDEILPTPNVYRTASGAPGHEYWQQQANYDIDVEIDDEKQRIIGAETINYINKSPDPLRYVWIALENNIFRPDSDSNMTRTASDPSRMSFDQFKAMEIVEKFPGGVDIKHVRDGHDQDLKYTVVKTMMRVDLAEPLKPGEASKLKIGWEFNINGSDVISARTGFEFFERDGNYIYEMAHWFPRMVSYTDYQGWQHKQFLGRGEFTLEFGDYVVRITVPNDHIVAATGELLNATEVLTEEQQARLTASRTAEKPMFVVTPEEAKANESSEPTGKKTWIFKADRVRDFAFASSRKFIWDAMGHDVDGNKTLAMSFYPNEGEPLWSRYSTHAIIHTLNVYSRYTFKYPYPVAISVNGPVGGMEYPMICFNGPRPEEDGTYSPRTKYGLISVIIHEVGHNYFPMIVNSDERQWTWMDEGLNTFVQFLAEQEWEPEYPSRRGEPAAIVGYMGSSNQVPIMTNSESILQFGPNAYSKPATALNILRETIMGRELFDFAFKEYARRWEFKRPTPADFFRTMEDASGIDLDWFWRGWFYTTDHVDLALVDIREWTVNTQDPEVEKGRKRDLRDSEPVTLSQELNETLRKRTDDYPELLDFYNSYDELDVTERDQKAYKQLLQRLTDEEKAALQSDRHLYVLDFENVGGLVMPIILEVVLEDGSKEMHHFPAEIWRRNNENVSRLVVTTQPIKEVVLDPRLETADTDLENNFFPRRITKSRFDLYKSSGRGGSNAMREAGLGKKPEGAGSEKSANEQK